MLRVDFRASAYWVSTLMSCIPGPSGFLNSGLVLLFLLKRTPARMFHPIMEYDSFKIADPGVKDKNRLVVRGITEHVPFLHKEGD